jgi:uncharacterized Ntn-hydrolase superfamily protein
MDGALPLARRSLPGTFSIAAADPPRGQVGVAVQSKALAVGSIVPWARAGVGAVATQGHTIARYGPDILDALERGATPIAALSVTVVSDPSQGLRQIGVVGTNGASASHTGAELDPWCGSLVGPCYAIQGGFLAGEAAVSSMRHAFLETSGSLAERLLNALEAGQAAGGDKRGQQSAALLVEQAGYRETSPERTDRLVDLRVDDHPEPIKELRRLLTLWQIRDMIAQAFIPYLKAEYQVAVEIMLQAKVRFPGNALVLVNLAAFECLAGHLADGLTDLGDCLRADPSFRQLASTDPDFTALRGSAEFEQLLSA